jgi:hypothetical protein
MKEFTNITIEWYDKSSQRDKLKSIYITINKAINLHVNEIIGIDGSHPDPNLMKLLDISPWRHLYIQIESSLKKETVITLTSDGENDMLNYNYLATPILTDEELEKAYDKQH